jgi:CRISPR-associated protein Cas5 subtype I-C
MGNKALNFAYNTLLGRSLWGVLFGTGFLSRLMGAYYDSKLSHSAIKSLLQIPGLDADEAEMLRKDENPGKYNAMFERRARKGQCFNQPYLGTREFSASFRLIDVEKEVLDAPINENRDLGLMLYDMNFEANSEKPDAMFYRAKMENGVIVVPPRNSKEVLR